MGRMGVWIKRDGKGFLVLRNTLTDYRLPERFVEVEEYEEGELAVLKTKAGYTILATPFSVEWRPPPRRSGG